MITKKKSDIHGFGIFAQKTIKKNKKIIQYTGEKIPLREGRRRDALYAQTGNLWTFELNSRWYIDAAVGGGLAKYVNHAEKPNCWVEIKNGEIWYRAGRTIEPGEELTVDYGTSLPKVES